MPVENGCGRSVTVCAASRRSRAPSMRERHARPAGLSRHLVVRRLGLATAAEALVEKRCGYEIPTSDGLA